MNCPLFDQNGQRRTLQTIEFDDFKQLLDIEEGYLAEYKGTWDDNVKKKIPKIISSFANAAGGWVFVGINDDGSYAGICKGITDFDLIVASLLRTRVTPLPRFETRFVKRPGSDDGVLVIEVYEGVTPPYVSNGTVYVRVGSSSEKIDPHTIRADNNTLIELYRKARYAKKEIEQFCHRTVFFPTTQVINGSNICTIPILNVFMKRLVSNEIGPIPYHKIDEITDLFERLYGSNGKYKFLCQHAHDSLIMRTVIGNPVDNVSPAIEVFYDGSIKINISLPWLQGNDLAQAINRLSSYVPIRNQSLARILDGMNSIALVCDMCRIVDGYLEATNKKLSDYALAVGYENMQGMMIDFKTETYPEYIREYGIPYVGTLDETTPFFTPSPEERGGHVTLSDYIQTTFIEACGIPIATADDALRDRVWQAVFDYSPIDEITPDEE